MKQTKLTGNSIQVTGKSAKRAYKYEEGSYDWEQVFEERIEERVDLNDKRLKFITNKEDFQTAIEEFYLTGNSNNRGKFWREIGQTEKLNRLLDNNKTNVKIQDKRDLGYSVKKFDDTIFYKFLFTNKKGRKVERFKDIKSGRFIKKPTGKTEVVKI